MNRTYVILVPLMNRKDWRSREKEKKLSKIRNEQQRDRDTATGGDSSHDDNDTTHGNDPISGSLPASRTGRRRQAPSSALRMVSIITLIPLFSYTLLCCGSHNMYPYVIDINKQW
jgi:hypothetical protein